MFAKIMNAQGSTRRRILTGAFLIFAGCVTSAVLAAMTGGIFWFSISSGAAIAIVCTATFIEGIAGVIYIRTENSFLFVVSAGAILVVTLISPPSMLGFIMAVLGGPILELGLGALRDEQR